MNGGSVFELLKLFDFAWEELIAAEYLREILSLFWVSLRQEFLP